MTQTNGADPAKPRRPLDRAREDIAKTRKAIEDAEYEYNMSAAMLMGDLRYPVSKDGSVLDLTYFAPLIAWHLIRCGWRNIPSRRKIKPRKITARGVVSDAVEWVPIDAPDDPLANLSKMTMSEINNLPPIQHAEAVRRMGGSELPDLPSNPGWHVATNLKIEDAPDPNDGSRWNNRKAAQ